MSAGRPLRLRGAVVPVATALLLTTFAVGPVQAQSIGSAIASFFGFGGSSVSAPARVSSPGSPALASAVPRSLTSTVSPLAAPAPRTLAPGSGAAVDDSDQTVAEAEPIAPDAPVASEPLQPPPPAPATAADATLTMANMMDGAGGGTSNADLMAALQSAAAEGQPMALWRLGTMYENGDGVTKDDVKAFGYFSQIANDHADAAPRGVDSDIVAQSFVKMGDYYRKGLPDAGISVDPEKADQLILHAATYFGNADAQYQVGELYLNATDDPSPLQGARWLALAAHKGHVAAQAKLGDLLFNGAGIKAEPTEGLMWLSVAHDRSVGTPDENWINELLTRDMTVATPKQRADANKLAEEVEPQFGPTDDSEPGD